MTFADKIRHMTDEQLAAWLCMITAPRGDGKKNMRLRTWLERLKQEAKVEPSKTPVCKEVLKCEGR